MSESIVFEKSKQFSVRIVNLYKYLKEDKKEYKPLPMPQTRQKSRCRKTAYREAPHNIQRDISPNKTWHSRLNNMKCMLRKGYIYRCSAKEERDSPH